MTGDLVCSYFSCPRPSSTKPFTAVPRREGIVLDLPLRFPSISPFAIYYLALRAGRGELQVWPPVVGLPPGIRL